MANYLGSGGGVLINVDVAKQEDGSEKITFLIADNDLGLYFLSYGFPTMPPGCGKPPTDPKAWLGKPVFYGPASTPTYTNPWYPDYPIANLRKVSPSMKRCFD